MKQYIKRLAQSPWYLFILCTFYIECINMYIYIYMSYLPEYKVTFLSQCSTTRKISIIENEFNLVCDCIR
jgi:hypothetical protein